MKRSRVYYTILNKPFFIDVRRMEARNVFVSHLLAHDTQQLMQGQLSDTDPLPRLLSLQGGGTQRPSSFADAPAESVAVVDLHGDMLKEGTPCTYGTTEVAAMLREAADTDAIIGTVLDIDSGGGSVDAVAPMLDAIAYSQDTKGKPVVALCDLCASAAYYVASACLRIVAANDISAEFGSIGVMTQFLDYAKYYELKGIKVHTIYSDLSDHKNAPFEAALKGDYKSVKEEMLNPLARKFRDFVTQHRPALHKEEEGILSGRMFYAADALRLGLIDQVGNQAAAVAAVRSLSAELRLRALAR